MVGMITNVQILGGPHPENLGGQKPQKLVQFWTNFEFDLVCLRNQMTYQKSRTNLIKSDPRRV